MGERDLSLVLAVEPLDDEVAPPPELLVPVVEDGGRRNDQEDPRRPDLSGELELPTALEVLLLQVGLAQDGGEEGDDLTLE